MRKRCQILLGLIGMLAMGCQQSPYIHAHLEMINAEKRALEDQLYDLEFDYQEACRKLAALQHQGVQSSSSSSPSADNANRNRRGSSSSGDSKSEIIPPMVDEGTLVEPRIELPPATDSPGSPRLKPESLPGTPPPVPPSMDPRSSKKLNGAKATSSAAVAARPESLEPADPRVTHIFLNPLLTGGRDFDRQPGDDGLVVVVEPRNRDDAFVPLAGPITVVILDPAKTAEEGRIVERWEINANEAQKSLRNSATMHGIELRLPWSAAPPTGRLHLHVRYMTVDNRDLRSDRPLFLTLPGQFTQQWTPRGSSPSASGGSLLDAQDTQDNPSTTPTVEHAGGQITSQISPAARNQSPSPAAALAVPLQAKRPEWRPTR
jgi:hypothetical protein